MKLAVFVLALFIVFFGVACSSDAKPEGGATPSEAALRLAHALNQGNAAEVRVSTEPDRRQDTLNAEAFGLNSPAFGAGDRPAIQDISARPDYAADRGYALVELSGRLSDGRSFTSHVVYTVEVEGRWYATTQANAYWSGVHQQAIERQAAARDTVTAAFEAQLNADPSLPGEYIKPHPGPDGVLCSSRACSGSMDDRRHVSNIVSIPICSQQDLEQNRIGDPICYTSNPPTSGPHAQTAAPFGVLRTPASKESLVHNMEHGGVVIWYNTTNQAVLDQLQGIVTAENARGRMVVMSLYTEMERESVAVTSWTRLYKTPVSEFSAEQVQAFISRHERRFNPEGF